MFLFKVVGARLEKGHTFGNQSIRLISFSIKTCESLMIYKYLVQNPTVESDA